MIANLLRLSINNWKPALTVALVNIPLSIALAIACGATPTQGIITAFWAGLLAGIFGSSHFNITGPTGAISGILVAYALVNGYAVLPFVAILSGILILAAYALHLDKYIIFIPRSVIHGFTLGIAFIIALGQLDNATGLIGVPKTESLLHNVWISLQHSQDINGWILGIFLIGTIFIILWNKRFPKMPGAIIISFIGIIAALVLQKTGSDFQFFTLGEKYPGFQATLFENSFSSFAWSLLADKGIWLISIATAVIAILETLLSGKIADHMTGTRFVPSKEVLGLGIANIGSGLMGGIPATGALARTALNIKSGATHKISSTLNVIFLGLITLFLLSFFQKLPMVVIASILVAVAIGMVEKKHFINLIENEKVSFYLSLLVALITVVEDPIIGIVIGTFIALLIFVNRVSYGQTEVLVWKNGQMIESILKNEFIKKGVVDSDVIVYKISGTLTYVNMPAHLEAAQKIKGNKHVIISLRHAFYADTDGIEYLKEIIEILKGQNEKVILAGINREVEKLIMHEPFYKQKLVEGKIYKRTSEALNHIFK